MIPLWVVIVILLIFIGSIFWERYRYRCLVECQNCATNYLAYYVEKYGFPPFKICNRIYEIDEDKEEK